MAISKLREFPAQLATQIKGFEPEQLILRPPSSGRRGNPRR